MSYLLIGEEWPKKDPITGRELCAACWAGAHGACGQMFTVDNKVQCDHYAGRNKGKCACVFDCDCIHLSEAQFAAEEHAKYLANRRAKRELLREMRDAPDNPLRAIKEVERPRL